MNNLDKMERWNQFTERLHNKLVARLKERDRSRSPEDRERHKRMVSDLISATQKELFKRTRPLPNADHVIEAAEQLMRKGHNDKPSGV